MKEEGEFNVQNVMRMKYARNFENQELINKDGNLFLTVDSLIRINNIQIHKIYISEVIMLNLLAIINITWMQVESKQSCTVSLISSTTEE